MHPIARRRALLVVVALPLSATALGARTYPDAAAPVAPTLQRGADEVDMVVIREGSEVRLRAVPGRRGG